MRLAKLSFIDIFLAILSEAKNLSAKCYTQPHEPVTIAATSFNNGCYVKGKISVWQEIDWPKLGRESPGGINNYDSGKLITPSIAHYRFYGYELHRNKLDY
jgi:hypothetical protein